MTDLADRMQRVRSLVAAAAARVRRDPSAVTVIAVTKTFPPDRVAAVVAAGFADIGENYVQEGRAKRAVADAPGARWHLIGGLQRNKVRAAVAAFDRVHTVDTIELGTALDTEAARAGKRLPVLLQVNVAGDPAKRGTLPGAAGDVAAVLLRCPHLQVDGLMTIGSLTDDPEEARRQFRALRALRDDVAARLGVELPHLSMGMSDDFEIAIEEGATFVRLGRVLLGERQGGPWREGA